MGTRIYRSQALKGFTLIEAMVVVSIAVILVGLAAPSFKDMLDNQRLTGTVNDFFSAINLTRARAIDIGDRVDLGPRDGQDWTKGWVVFINKDENKSLYDADDTLIMAHDPVPKDLTIESNMSDNATKYIAFTGTGFTRTNGNGHQYQSGTITFTLGKKVRCISLNFIGRPRVYQPGPGVTKC